MATMVAIVNIVTIFTMATIVATVNIEAIVARVGDRRHGRAELMGENGFRGGGPVPLVCSCCSNWDQIHPLKVSKCPLSRLWNQFWLNMG